MALNNFLDLRSSLRKGRAQRFALCASLLLTLHLSDGYKTDRGSSAKASSLHLRNDDDSSRTSRLVSRGSKQDAETISLEVLPAAKLRWSGDARRTPGGISKRFHGQEAASAFQVSKENSSTVVGRPFRKSKDAIASAQKAKLQNRQVMKECFAWDWDTKMGITKSVFLQRDADGVALCLHAVKEKDQYSIDRAIVRECETCLQSSSIDGGTRARWYFGQRQTHKFHQCREEATKDPMYKTCEDWRRMEFPGAVLQDESPDICDSDFIFVVDSVSVCAARFEQHLDQETRSMLSDEQASAEELLFSVDRSSETTDPWSLSAFNAAPLKAFAKPPLPSPVRIRQTQANIDPPVLEVDKNALSLGWTAKCAAREDDRPQICPDFEVVAYTQALERSLQDEFAAAHEVSSKLAVLEKYRKKLLPRSSVVLKTCEAEYQDVLTKALERNLKDEFDNARSRLADMRSVLEKYREKLLSQNSVVLMECEEAFTKALEKSLTKEVDSVAASDLSGRRAILDKYREELLPRRSEVLKAYEEDLEKAVAEDLAAEKKRQQEAVEADKAIVEAEESKWRAADARPPAEDMPPDAALADEGADLSVLPVPATQPQGAPGEGDMSVAGSAGAAASRDAEEAPLPDRTEAGAATRKPRDEAAEQQPAGSQSADKQSTKEQATADESEKPKASEPERVAPGTATEAKPTETADEQSARKEATRAEETAQATLEPAETKEAPGASNTEDAPGASNTEEVPEASNEEKAGQEVSDAAEQPSGGEVKLADIKPHNQGQAAETTGQKGLAVKGSVDASGADATSKPESKGENVAQLLTEDIDHQDAAAFRQHLDLESAEGYVNTLLGSDAQGVAKSSASTCASTTILGKIVLSGWLDGLKALLEWNWVRKKAGKQPQLELDAVIGMDDRSTVSRQCRRTALHAAVQAGRSRMVEELLLAGASVSAWNPDRRTALEAALAGKNERVAEELLNCGTCDLNLGLMPLYQRIRPGWQGNDGQVHWWTDLDFDTAYKIMMDNGLQQVPLEYQPRNAEEKELVGYQPAAWLLWYKTHCMHTFYMHGMPSQCMSWTHCRTRVGELLAAHGFDEFQTGFYFSVVVAGVVFGVFALSLHVISRVRVYGDFQAPLSCADLLPGAVEPSRGLDPIFDPGRMKAKLPYREVEFKFSNRVLGRAPYVAMDAFLKALLGCYNSWLLHLARIPPEQDPYDEDYLSEDDEHDRVKVRERCVRKALHIYFGEVAGRTLALLCCLWWLVACQVRVGDVLLISLLSLYFGIVSGQVASMSALPLTPKETEDIHGESKPSPSMRRADSTVCISHLFAAQVGPRWTRAICTTRSTAVPSKPRTLREAKRSRRAGTDVASTTSSSKVDECDGIVVSLMGDWRGTASESANSFSICFQKAFVRSGLIDLRHVDFLVLSVASILIVQVAIAGLTWANRANFDFYSLTPRELFATYGSPGSFQRWLAVGFELLFVALCAERLYSIINILHVALMSLRQRIRAISFVKQHWPSLPYNRAFAMEMIGPDKILEAVCWMQELSRCTEFTLQLSGMRWKSLRVPVFTIYLVTMLMLISSIFACMAQYTDQAWVKGFKMIDPVPQLVVASCSLLPLSLVLITAAKANQEVVELRKKFVGISQEVLASAEVPEEGSGIPSDTQYVQLRVLAYDALKDDFLEWPLGFSVGYTQLVCLLTTSVLAFSTVLVPHIQMGMFTFPGEGSEGSGVMLRGTRL